MEPVVTTTTSIVISQPALLGMVILGIVFVGFVALSYLKAKLYADSARNLSSQRESELLLWAYQQAAAKKAQTLTPAEPDRVAA